MSDAVKVESKASQGFEAPTFGVIWLHGLGADGHDFEPIVPEIVRPAQAKGKWPAIEFLFPHAPVRPVTINGGMRMRAWYDIKSLDRSSLGEAPGLRDSIAFLHESLAAFAARGIPAERVFVIGFSQGGAVALAGGLRFDKQLAGIAGLSTYLPLAESLRAELAAANRDTPILIAHGTQDPVVPIGLAEESRKVLSALSVESQWRTYPMPHSVCAEEIEDLRNWMQVIIDKTLQAKTDQAGS
jgi:phospholipase/carboxylesterase